MRRNAAFALFLIVVLLLGYNSFQKIRSLAGNSQKVEEAAGKLERLKAENEQLKQELEYKKSDKFKEEEIRNKLGLAKPGEEVFVVPKDDNSRSSIDDSRDERSNVQKWKEYLFEGS